MKTVPAAMQAVLDAGGPFKIADLYTFTLSDGTVLRWTGSQAALTVGGNTFELGPPISRKKISWKLGLSVDSLDITLTDDGSTQINGEPLISAAWKNLLDDAKVTVDRFISDSWDHTSVGSVNMFTGIVGDVKAQGKKVTVTVESELAQLKATMPRTQVLPHCANTLFDGVCGLLAANFTYAGTVGSSPTATSFTLSGVSQPDDYFAQGKVEFTSGVNSGQVRQIKTFKGGVVTLAYPLYDIPAQGDGVSIVAGCDKTRATCQGRFANLAHFRGFPYVPDPSTQYSGGSTDAGGNGGSGGGSAGGGPARGGRGRHGLIRLR